MQKFVLAKNKKNAKKKFAKNEGENLRIFNKQMIRTFQLECD